MATKRYLNRLDIRNRKEGQRIVQFGHVHARAVHAFGARGSGCFISDHEFDELQRLRALERRVYGVEELLQEVAEAIEKSKMDPSHSHLDAHLDEK